MPFRPRFPMVPSARSFHCSTRVSGLSPLFHLQGLSTSRETQWLSKASGLSRIEHSPGLQLLRSEADLQRSAKEQARAAPDSAPKPVSSPPKGNARPAADVVTVARPWIRKIRQDLDEFDRSLANHRLLTARHGPGAGDAEDASLIERGYEDRIRRQEEQLAALKASMEQEQIRYQSDLKTWAAVKLQMNSHKERAETAGALSIVVATVLAAVLYYQQYHAPTSIDTPLPQRPAAHVAEPARAPVDPSEMIDATTPTAALPPSPSAARVGEQRKLLPATRGVFWQN